MFLCLNLFIILIVIQFEFNFILAWICHKSRMLAYISILQILADTDKQAYNYFHVMADNL